MSLARKYNTFLRSPLGSLLVPDIQDEIGDYVFMYEDSVIESTVLSWIADSIDDIVSFYINRDNMRKIKRNLICKIRRIFYRG